MKELALQISPIGKNIKNIAASRDKTQAKPRSLLLRGPVEAKSGGGGGFVREQARRSRAPVTRRIVDISVAVRA